MVGNVIQFLININNALIWKNINFSHEWNNMFISLNEISGWNSLPGSTVGTILTQLWFPPCGAEHTEVGNTYGSSKIKFPCIVWERQALHSWVAISWIISLEQVEIQYYSVLFSQIRKKYNIYIILL